MKVVFLFGGLPHYYNLILNKLNRIDGLVIAVIVPAEKSETIGAGVHESSEGIDFDVHRLKEYKTFYGKYYFEGLSHKIQELKPDIIVVSYSYGIGILFDFALRKLLKKQQIKIAFKTIPFEEPMYANAVSHYAKVWFQKGKMFPGKKLLAHIFSFLFVHANKRTFNLFDAHINYVDEAIELYGSYGVPANKIFITYNSPDTEEIDAIRNKVLTMPSLYGQDEINLLHIGRLVQWKRVDLLIAAFTKLKTEFPNLKLKIVGNGPEMESLVTQVKQLEITNSVEFTGAIYDPIQLGRIMHSCDIYILAGIGGLSINEAMIYGLPVICSVADGTEKKLVLNGYNGFRIKPDSLEDLITTTRQILLDKDLMEAMGANSRKIIENEVNEKVVIDGYLKAFFYLVPNASLSSKN